MKIYTALKVSKKCGFRTVGEALLNIQLNAINMFGYTASASEVAELTATWFWVRNHRKTPDGGKLDEDTEIELLLNNHIVDSVQDYELYQRDFKKVIDYIGQEMGRTIDCIIKNPNMGTVADGGKKIYADELSRIQTELFTCYYL